MAGRTEKLVSAMVLVVLALSALPAVAKMLARRCKEMMVVAVLAAL